MAKFYKHYKGGIYELIGIGKHTETGEMMVIYKDENEGLWVRPRSVFNEILVSSEGLEIERFKYIGKERPEKRVNLCGGKIMGTGTKLSTPEGDFVIVSNVDNEYRVLCLKRWILSTYVNKTPRECFEQLIGIYGQGNVSVKE